MEHEHGTRISEHLKTNLDGSGIDKSLETPLMVAGESGHPNLTNVNESRLLEVNSTSTSSLKPTNPFLSLENSNNYPEAFYGSYGNDYPSIRTVAIDDEDDLFCPSIKLGSSSSSSTPRSASSIDIWKVNAVKDAKPISTTHADEETKSARHENENTKSASPAIEDTSYLKNANEETKSAMPLTSLPPQDKDSPPFVPEDNKSNIAKNGSRRSETSDNRSSTSSLTFHVADNVHEQLEGDMSPTLSPQIQIMDRSGGYDPARIPSSVFETSNTTSPMDWSACSNESLFSIHVGNNSFSRNNMSMFGDLGKSGELTKSGELIVLSPPPPLQITDTETNSLDKWKEPEAEGITDLSVKTQPYVNMKDEKSETIKAASSVNTKVKKSEKRPPATANLKYPSLSRRSDASGTSTHSFAFPIMSGAQKNGSSIKQGKDVELSNPLDALENSRSTWRLWFSCFSCRSCNCNAFDCRNCSCPSCC